MILWCTTALETPHLLATSLKGMRASPEMICRMRKSSLSIFSAIMCVVLILAKIRNYSIVSVVNRRKVERICCILSESEAYYLIFVGCKRCFFTLIGYSADMCQSTCYIYSCSGKIYQNRKKGVACGSSRKLTQACGAFAGVPASFSQVCGSFAGVPASQLKRAGRLREFPQAHSNVRRI